MSDFTPSLVTLARWSSGLQRADIPPAVQDAAKRCLIDTLGVALAGSRSTVAAQARAVIAITAGAGKSTVLGQARHTAAPAAAFANATAAHALDFDDNCYPGFVHGSAVILPAALAVAQMRDLSGARLLAAIVAGAECEYALAKALTRQIYDQGWWTTGVLGVVGACAAACHGLGLNADQTAAALGLAIAGTGGMKAGFGSDAKMLMAGRSSEAGVIAALLASHGSRGPLDVIEHEKGLAAMFNGGLLNPLPTLGSRWSLIYPGVDIKRVPVCLSSHAAIDALRELLDEGEVRVEDIDAILCDVPPIVIQNLVHDAPVTRQQAQFSMPFALAYTALLGDITLDSLDATVLARADLQQLMKRVRMASSARWQTALLDSAPEGAWVKVVRRDGTCVERFCAMPVGSASRPLSSAQLHHKFMHCATGVWPVARAQRLFDDLSHLEDLPGVRDLLTCETPPVETMQS
ncbi:MmgE/PrpD family protein [Pseudomonas sp. SLFW]|uniref:MmgE/PrpD family protein n=1 Tax=Pseudomonas sp. SLFW TaxID=2683259 RepID=UPI001411F5B7|nr:MmgE/PrpD family protein [Pseudomonas sp. SLFW]NBB09471.1 MmgE/PrpD family protein [Pseudomonas sp. SLFW]